MQTILKLQVTKVAAHQIQPQEKSKEERVYAISFDLSRSLPWFTGSVRNIQMLRIEELIDLMPAVQQGNPPRSL